MIAQATPGMNLNNGTPQGGDICSRAMLVSLSKSVWSARKFDKDVTHGIAKQYGTSEKACRANKALLPEASPSYAKVTKAAAALYRAHCKFTAPWGEDGIRILSTVLYWDYCEAIRVAKEAFTSAVREFLADLPRLKQIAKTDPATAGLYKEEDWPSLRAIARRFGVCTHAYPLPRTSDFRLNLAPEAVKEIKADLQSNSQAILESAVQDVWGRLYTQVQAITTRLQGDKTLHATSFENLGELCDILDKLNLTGDPNLTQMIQESRSHLTSKPATDNQREILAEKAAEIQGKMAGYMQAWEDEEDA